MTQTPVKDLKTVDWDSEFHSQRLRRRHRSETILKALGISAIIGAVALLGVLIISLGATGFPAFTQTFATIPVYIDPAKVKKTNPARGNYRVILRNAMIKLFPDVSNSRDRRKLVKILTHSAKYQLRDMIKADPALIGKVVQLKVPVSDPFDQLNKGVIDRHLPASKRRVSDKEIAWFDHLVKLGLISRNLNWALIFNPDSRFPEMAGLKGAIWGSFYALLVCFLISFPVGIAAAIYLEEFAPKGRIPDLIEVNINNLAAVPSVVFGLLGLAVFLGWFGLPRSTPLVGGMVLSLMTLPTIIIATRAALKQVPPSIREAALGLGATRHQVILHHVLPLAMPGILTGTIIGLAQALGETAPLLLIGMNAFITGDPGTLLEPATSLPTQIYSWADSPERGFVARTSAAIIVLIGFLITMNLIAVILRQRTQKNW